MVKKKDLLRGRSWWTALMGERPLTKKPGPITLGMWVGVDPEVGGKQSFEPRRVVTGRRGKYRGERGKIGPKKQKMENGKKKYSGRQKKKNGSTV